MVSKSSGGVQPFERDKIVAGILAATKGRAIDEAVIEQVALDIEDEVRLLGNPVRSSRIGLAVLDRLRTVDEVAYLRFASVYKNFDDASDFRSELELLGKLKSQPNG